MAMELLAPAGDFETVKAVIGAGADAVYLGGDKFGARAYARNLKKEEILSAIDFGHIHGRKIFLTVNTLLKEKEVEEQLYEYLLPYYERGLDAAIVQDFGVMQFIRRNFTKLPVHTSTQMNVSGVLGAEFLTRMGAKRIVMARELSLEEISRIHREVSVELECFVHGALCYCYSGQCLFSSILGGRSGNRGRCAQPCRLPYDFLHADFTKVNDKAHNYPLSLKDLCTIDQIPELAESGIYSLKIEGRMKQAEYAKGVVAVYRSYIDRYLAYGKKDFSVSRADKKRLFDLGNRSGFTDGYYGKKNGPDMVTFLKPEYKKADDLHETGQMELKEKIAGDFFVKENQPSRFTVSFLDTTATAEGEVPGTAKNQPLTADILRARLQKTGNTPFAFEKLNIKTDPGLFLSASAVNELRRKALLLLEEKYLEKYRRTQPDNLPLSVGQAADASSFPKDFFVSASAQTGGQLEALLSCPFLSRIYIDSIMWTREELTEKLQWFSGRAKAAGKEVYYIFPAVFRNETAAFYESVLQEIKTDGFLVKNYDALGFLLKHHIKPEKIRTDHSLYTWSNESRHAFYALGIEGDTIPLELSKKEIRARKNTGSEMLIYGYLPLMISAQCLLKNLCGCGKTPSVHYLKDRYGISFPVKNHCGECYNVIYNSRPLQLFDAAEELKSFGVGSFRFSFTVESKEQTKKTLEIYERKLPFGAEYTCGHYKRGVE